MKKKCENCGNFTGFYTRIGIRYFKTDCGRCWVNKTITGCDDVCEQWEAKPIDGNHEQEELFKAFDTVITNLNVIKNNLTEQ